MKDYYKILGVLSSAEPAAIKGAYQGLAKTYHPDKYNGDIDTANLRMSEINEAWAVLSDLQKKKEYDQGNKEIKVTIISQTSFNELKTLNPTISEIQEESIANLSIPQFFTEFQFSREQAREKFKSAFELISKKLPNDVMLNSVLMTTRGVVVPFYFFSGLASGTWSATVSLTDKKEITCAMCKGAGTTGRVKNKERCRTCRGSGKDTRSSQKKFIESGDSSISYEGLVPNYESEVDFGSIQLNTSNVVSLENVDITYIKCLHLKYSSQSDCSKSAQDILMNKLLDKAYKSVHNNYDDVHNLEFDDKMLNSEVEVLGHLHPAYICWFEIKNKKYFAICDAVTGKVTMPNFTSKDLPLSKVKKIFLTLLMLILGLIIIGVFVGEEEDFTEHSSKGVISASEKKELIDENNADLSPEVVAKVPNFKPSFICDEAPSKSETIICSDEELSNLDHELSQIYEGALSTTTDVQSMKQSAKTALEWRNNNCNDKTCIQNWYAERIDVLTQIETQADSPLEIGDKSNAETTNEFKSCTQAEIVIHANGC